MSALGCLAPRECRVPNSELNTLSNIEQTGPGLDASRSTRCALPCANVAGKRSTRVVMGVSPEMDYQTHGRIARSMPLCGSQFQFAPNLLGIHMDVCLRPHIDKDLEFVRSLYFETMRWAIEPLFGWDEESQEATFAEWFKADEASIITADGQDAGWIHQRLDRRSVFLGSIHVAPAMPRKSIGRVIKTLLAMAGLERNAITLAVMKVNPASALYERLGFVITDEDEYKFYMRAEPNF